MQGACGMQQRRGHVLGEAEVQHVGVEPSHSSSKLLVRHLMPAEVTGKYIAVVSEDELFHVVFGKVKV